MTTQPPDVIYMTMPPLTGRVAVVAGATRGAGRGIARMLGEAGATVYCTGRSTRGNPAGSRPETIDETADLVSAEGGVGIAVRTDHTVPSEVEALFTRVRAEQGRLDLLVNDIWGGDDLTEFGTPFWRVSVEKGLVMLQRAVFAHIITARYGTPLLLDTGAGLIVEITDGDSFTYRGNVFYDLAKISAIRLAFAMARELRKTKVTAVALTPGFLRSEAMLERFGVTESNWRDGARGRPEFLGSETPCFVGRAVVALATDPAIAKKSGRVFSSWDLSDEYGFGDIDGERPHWGRFAAEHFGPGVFKTADDAMYDTWRGGAIDTIYADWP
jgi:NAD(P)-dependent dehydrogenase (short-subunit alcohol dehydrogenase family)